jgi:oligoendopeptidase F
MTTSSPHSRPTVVTRQRHEIPEPLTWNLRDIYAGPAEWDAACTDLGDRIEQFAKLQGTLGRGPERLLSALRATDALGQLAYKVYYHAALTHDQDQRDNGANARKQRVQALLARWAQATSWFNPELLKIPIETVHGWLADHAELVVYRFAIDELYRQQEHVLDEDGERILSLASRLEAAPDEAYEALSTADVRWPTIRLASGDEVTVTYGQYRALLATSRVQADRALAFEALHDTFARHQNTYAALYNGVLQRDWFAARARHHKTALDAALFGNAVPTAVVENLVATTRAGVEPLRRYHRLRKAALGLDSYHVYDTSVPLVEADERYEYGEVIDWIVESAAPLGPEYQARMRAGFEGRWIDVYESPGKRSGAYSAPVYGVHPYMLLNWNHTLDAVFTLAHEMGHSMHTLYSHERQPFVYSGYTIFVAEVPSTLSEALLLELLLARHGDPQQRILLLTHAIDEMVGTFYTQVMFADFELQAHRLVEQGEPVTAERLGDVFADVQRAYNGDVLTYDDLSRVTWARIPHFFNSPYYVYQYATCYASTARLFRSLVSGPQEARAAAVDRYLTLLSAGGSDHPMTLLAAAGADLRDPGTVRAVIDQCDGLVSQLELELRDAGRLRDDPARAADGPTHGDCSR